MRDALLDRVSTYPAAPGWRDGSFKGAKEKLAVERTVPGALQDLLWNKDRYIVEGSAGQGDWTKTPWVAVLDQSITTSTEDGFYLVYLLSHGCDRLYPVVGQGCTRLLKESEKPKHAKARKTLLERASIMRARAAPHANRLSAISMDLSAKGWRADLYEHSVVLGCEYATSALPDDDTLIADFREAIKLYRVLAREGGWSSDDEIAQEAEQDGIEGGLSYLKSYRQHRRAERSAKHSKEVKKRHKPECAACGFKTKGAYQIAKESDLDILEAHHLVPLHTLAEGETARFDIMKDFALLCPNCHRMIHRLGAEDLKGLQKLVKRK